MIYQKKLLFLIAFVGGFFFSLQGQSTIQPEINLLNNYLKTMQRLENKPNWKSKAYQLRYRDYIGRLEKVIQKIKQKEAGYNLSLPISKLQAYRQTAAVHSAENKQVTKSPYQGQRKSNRQREDIELTKRETTEKQQIAILKKEMEAKIAAQNTAGEKAWEQLRQTSATAHAEAEKNRESDKQAFIRQKKAMEARTDGILIETPCGQYMEYCIVDSQGQVCTQISANATEFRKCTFPVKVYIAIEGQKTTLVANVSKAGTPVRLCE